MRQGCCQRWVQLWTPILVLGVWFVWGTLPTALSAPAAAEEQSVRSAGEALRQQKNTPWYDSESDSLAPIDLPAPRKPWNWPSIPWQVIGWTALGILVAIAIFLVTRIFWEHNPPPDRETQQATELLAADRVEALPFLAERPRDDLLGEARRHYEAGNYSEAIIYLFSYQLVELDKSALIHLAKGKTNRQYLRESGRVQALKGMLEKTMIAFEDVFFGSRRLDRTAFEACWNQLPQFDQLIAQAAV